MSTVPYIILQDSTGSGGYFAVVMGGYVPATERDQQVRRTNAGTLDISQGANFESHQYTIRCRHTETRDGYGTFDELKRLYKLNNPAGTPSDRVTFTDHFGTQRYCYFVGKFPWEAVTTVLEGADAWYFVPITLLLEPV